VKTQRQRQDERRKEQLEHIQSQIDAGKLVVRQMTPAEREKATRGRKAKQKQA
jgi:hypothetical protein